MKEHLVRLLLEEYKQQCLFEELERKGISLANICVNNLAIVLDIIGFPPDNTREYSLNGEPSEKKQVDDNLFCRDWLTERYFETFTALANQQKVCVTDHGLQIESGADKDTVQEQWAGYIDWLYSEFQNLDDTQ